MSVTLQQTDTASVDAIGAFGTGLSVAGSHDARTATSGGTPGTGTHSIGGAGGAGQIGIMWETAAGECDSYTCPSGTWSASLDVTVGNANVTWTDLYVIRVNSSGTAQQTIGHATSPTQALSPAQTFSMSVAGASAATFAAGDRVVILLVFSLSGAGSFTYKPDAAITTPMTTTPVFDPSAALISQDTPHGRSVRRSTREFRPDNGVDPSPWAALLPLPVGPPTVMPPIDAPGLAIRHSVRDFRPDSGVGPETFAWLLPAALPVFYPSWDQQQGIARRPTPPARTDFTSRVYPVLEDPDQTFPARQPDPVQPARRQQRPVAFQDMTPAPLLLPPETQIPPWYVEAAAPRRRPPPFRPDPGCDAPGPAGVEIFIVCADGPPRFARRSFVAATPEAWPPAEPADDPRILPDWQADAAHRFPPRPRFAAAVGDPPPALPTLDVSPWSGALDARQGLALRSYRFSPAQGDGGAAALWEAAYIAAYTFAEAWAQPVGQPRRIEPRVRPTDSADGGWMSPNVVVEIPWLPQDADQPRRRPSWFLAAPAMSEPWLAVGGPAGPGIIIVAGPYYIAAAEIFCAGTVAGDLLGDF